MKTLGIDLATEPRKTGAVTVDWAGQKLTVHDDALTNDRLIELIGAADVAAIDVPLGWPAAFIDAILKHRDGSWPVDTRAREWRKGLQYRCTDFAVHQKTGKWPLSIAADRIGSTAMRGAALQHELVANGHEVDRSGVNGTLIETYPAGALRCWGLTSTGYKSGGGAAAKLLKVIRDLADDSPRWLSEQIRGNLIGRSDDVVDAAVCAIVAAAKKLDLTRVPTEAQATAAMDEGWIHLPTTGLDEIAHRAARAGSPPDC